MQCVSLVGDDNLEVNSKALSRIGLRAKGHAITHLTIQAGGQRLVEMSVGRHSATRLGRHLCSMRKGREPLLLAVLVPYNSELKESALKPS